MLINGCLIHSQRRKLMTPKVSQGVFFKPAKFAYKRLCFFPSSSHPRLFAVPRFHRTVSPGGVCRLLAGGSAQLSGGGSDGPGVSHLLLHL